MTSELYVKPVLISKQQYRAIGQGKMITVSRKKQTLNVALKGYSDEKARIKTQMEKLKAQYKNLCKK